MIFSGYSSLSSLIYTRILGLNSYYYLAILGMVMILFLGYRFPYIYSPFFFAIVLMSYVFFCFVSLLLARFFNSPLEFFSGFVPLGTPLYICPLVCCAETISYIIRPFVMIFRPFINLSLGCFGAVAVGQFCVANWWWLLILSIVFFYEVFVALVHWYIVTSILSFSVDH
uniref:ATP synthase subunit 6 n=1 Tax=Diphyllobothrium stemmacephalum TaxID=108521 RepID=A0A347Z8N1_9CEST|nr:ATP synthase F0 subunit 6 [Diphyllobothrium stemmacephalum]BBA26478.1 ATP synthase subunit 6 [Diphyllobothrium stemmacephalum]